MAQQMVNGSRHDGSVTFTYPMSNRYAVVGQPFKGKHLKSQDPLSLKKRKDHWILKNLSHNKADKNKEDV